MSVLVFTLLCTMPFESLTCADILFCVAGVPVFVMLPLDTIKVVHHPDGTSESCIQNELSLDIALQTLKSVGVQVRCYKCTVIP